MFVWLLRGSRVPSAALVHSDATVPACLCICACVCMCVCVCACVLRGIRNWCGNDSQKLALWVFAIVNLVAS